MAVQTFTAGSRPQVALIDCANELTIEGWDEQNIAVEAEDGAAQPVQEGETLTIRGAHASVRLRVPSAAAVTVRGQQGSVYLRNVYGDVLVDGAESLRIESDEELFRRIRRWLGNHHDVEARNVGAIEIDSVIGNLTIADSQRASAHAIGGNAAAQRVKGDLRLDNIGGNCEIREVGGALHLDNVGGNCEVGGIAGELKIDNVGGNCEIRDVGAVLRVGNIGGNLTLNAAPLSAAFGVEQPVRIAVGGNARLELPDQPNLTVRAVVGGHVSGAGIGSRGSGVVTLVYGEGTARLSMMVGGNLDLHGAGAPQSVSSFGPDWGEFGKEMGRHGRELGRMGRKLGREFGGMGHEMGREFGELGRELSQEFGKMGREIGRAFSEAFEGRRVRDDQPQPERRASQPVSAEVREQRAAVLRMVAEGRITAEEGAALIRALGDR